MTKRFKDTCLWLGMGFKLGGIKKQKGGHTGLENRMSPLKWRRLRKDLVVKLNLFPQKEEEKYLRLFYKINIKKVLI